jgi:hypothetical protein
VTAKPRKARRAPSVDEAVDELWEEIRAEAAKHEKDYFGFSWWQAIWEIDHGQGKSRLVEMLRRAEVEGIPRAVVPHLRNLLERYDLKRVRGRPQTPSYDRTDADLRIELALDMVRSWRQIGMPREQAIEGAAATHGVDARLLRQAYDGRLGSWRRKRAKRDRGTKNPGP